MLILNSWKWALKMFMKNLYAKNYANFKFFILHFFSVFLYSFQNIFWTRINEFGISINSGFYDTQSLVFCEICFADISTFCYAIFECVGMLKI
jgi:hypothetical protein